MQDEHRERRQVRKLLGADIELANFVDGLERASGTGDVASRALLKEIPGVRSLGRPSPTYHGGQGTPYTRGDDPQDWGRKYLASNGGCVYIDLCHLELCTPEVCSAYDFTAAVHAMFGIAADAQQRVNAQLPEQCSIRVLANNSDGFSHSFGSHLSFLVTREAWNDLFRYRLQHLLFLASFQVSSIVFTGQGKVGSENGQEPCDYQISQRADFMETLCGTQTTYRRPIVNARDEELCGEDSGLARLHCIFFDSNLCHVANFLKVGTMQILLALIEAEALDLELLLDDPVGAVVHWSHGADLDREQPLLNGESVTAVELQLRFLAHARSAYAKGLLSVVDDVESILDLWEDTLEKLAVGDLEALTGRLDWVLKQHALESCLRSRPELDWASDEIKYLDLLYSSLDRADGLYWAYERAGLVEPIVSEAEIERLKVEPPEDTRAWTRAMVLRALPPRDFEEIDWHELKLCCHERDAWGERLVVKLPDPRADTRAANEPSWRQAESAEHFVRALAARSAGDEVSLPPLPAALARLQS